MGSVEVRNGLVHSNRERFREEIGQVNGTREMGDSKLKLRNPVPYPMEAHVDRLAHLSSNGAVG